MVTLSGPKISIDLREVWNMQRQACDIAKEQFLRTCRYQ